MDADGLEDLFAPVVRVSSRRMFGGHGIYAEGVMFAIQTSGGIWLRCDAQVELAFREAGSVPFSYDGKGRRVVLPYWQMPDEAYEDPDVLRRWVGLARAAAARHAVAKAAKADEKARKTAKAGKVKAAAPKAGKPRAGRPRPRP